MLVVFAILPFFSTLLGGTAALRLRHRLHPFMAFAAGVLVATALVDLLPEAADLISAADPTASPMTPGIATIVGFIGFSALDAFVHRETWEHRSQPGGNSERASVLGLLGPLSLIIHSTLDGLAIGLAFRAGGGLGLLVGMAVLAHDFADGMNVVTLSLVGGARVPRARALLILDALAPPAGVAIGTFTTLEGPGLGFLLAAFGGVFLAVGAGHLLPEAQHQRPGASPLLVSVAALGTVLVVAVRWLVG